MEWYDTRKVISVKKILSLLLCCTLLLTACGDSSRESIDISKGVEDTTVIIPNFDGMDDPGLTTYMKDSIYTELVDELNSEGYFVENVEAIYISQEYIDELTYNSQENIFFGYTLSDLDTQFQGKPYIFTLGENGETVVRERIPYDDTLDAIMKNVAIGTGVILICVTVSVVSGGVSAPAVSMIFATAAKTGTIMAVESAAIGGTASAVTTAISTGGNLEETMKSAALGASEGFKVGAIMGTVAGGAGEAIALKGATTNGLTMNQAAAIQKESKYPLDVIKNFQSPKQYKICKKAGLTTKLVGNKTALVRDIDLTFKDPNTGLTNLERMRKGLPALDSATGEAYELHHVGQNMDATLAILTKAEHRLGGNHAINHLFKGPSKIDRKVFETTVKPNFWKNLANSITGGV